MSNYHVEPAAQPQALTKEAIKSLRKQQVQGLSRRQLMRTALGSAIGLWLLEISAGTIDDIKNQNSALPIDEGFPAYFAFARSFVMLVDPSQQRFVPGEDATGDG